MEQEKRTTVEFRLKDLMGIGLVFVVTGIALAFGLEIMGDIKTDMGVDECAARTDGYNTYNAVTNTCDFNSTLSKPAASGAVNGSGNSITGVSNLTAKLPTLATVVIAAVIIGVLVSAFAFRT